MKRKVKELWSKRPRRKSKKHEDASLEQAIQNIPRITNETVAEHREEVLSGARKFIYPLQHSVRKIIFVSITIIAILVAAFFVYSILALYKFGTTSTFMYRATQVIPFPVAKAGPDFVAYENYLFDLRHYMHYYSTQQNVDFNSDSGKEQLDTFRELALQSVVDDAYIKQLAREHGISVSDRELQEEVQLLRSQNRLGSSDAVFEDVLQEFWGWTINDFERELRQQVLAQKVVSTLDTETHQRAQDVLNQLKNGDDFGELAKQFSDDAATKEQGGEYGFAIERTNRDLPPQVIDELFQLKAGETSGIIETPLGLEIVHVNDVNDSTLRASHIFFAFKDIDTYLDPLKAEKPQRFFISP